MLFLANPAIREPASGCNYRCMTFRIPLCRPVFAGTRERTRQIEAKALPKLRQPPRSGKLRSFLEDVHE